MSNYLCVNSCPGEWDPIRLTYIQNCEPYIPSSASCEAINSSSSAVASVGTEFTQQTVDSVMQVFNLGYHSGVLALLPVVVGALAIIIVAHLFSYAISKT